MIFFPSWNCCDLKVSKSQVKLDFNNINPAGIRTKVSVSAVHGKQHLFPNSGTGTLRSAISTVSEAVSYLNEVTLLLSAGFNVSFNFGSFLGLTI